MKSPLPVLVATLTFLIGPLFFAACASGQSGEGERGLPGWKTNVERRSIELDELISGGPPKDGIPSIDQPQFISPEEASGWLEPQEPVVSLIVEGVARAYPLQILTWHEIVNDEIAGVPVAVTFCPLCYSAIAFDRRAGERTLEFGVSGMLRHSDLVMYDRQTESLWQQLSGEAIVGDLTGTELVMLPAQLISFAQFAEAHPEGEVLSRRHEHYDQYQQRYGRNPYAGYDDVERTPFLYDGPFDDRLRPMEKVVTVSLGGEDKAYPHAVTRKQRVIHDAVGGRPLVVFHAEGAVSALDDGRISASRGIGSTGVFDPRLDGDTLRFRYEDGFFVDEATGSRWDVTGRAVAGDLAGKHLTPLPHGDFFSFAWFAFKPETKVYERGGDAAEGPSKQ